MTEVSLVGIKKNFGFKNILNEFDLEITTGDKVALIGPNGSGKSTIFKLISKEENPDQGTISIRKGASVAMLSQMPPVVSDDCDVRPPPINPGNNPIAIVIYANPKFIVK